MTSPLFAVTDTETTETTKVVKQKPAAYINWEILSKATGKTILKSDRGLTVWPYDPKSEYKSEAERQLVGMTKANGGMLEINMKVRIVIPGMASSDRTPEDLLAELLG